MTRTSASNRLLKNVFEAGSAKQDARAEIVFQQPANTHKQRGFTLLELMLVLGILGMAALLVAPGLTTLDTPSFNAQLREATGLLNYARRMAVVNGQPTSIAFYNQDSATREQDDRPVTAGQWQARGITLSYRESTGQQRDVDDVLEVVFYPEGGSTGGSLRMTQNNRQATIHIDPFSGRIRVERDD